MLLLLYEQGCREDEQAMREMSASRASDGEVSCSWCGREPREEGRANDDIRYGPGVASLQDFFCEIGSGGVAVAKTEKTDLEF